MLETIFLWCVDISVSAMINEGIVTNGFMSNSPMVTYHIGLWGAVLIPVIMSFMLVHHILKEEKKEV